MDAADNPWSSVADELIRRGQKLFLIEAGAGGVVCAAATAKPGASRWFAGGLVAYEDDLKRGCLQVPAATIERHGAVSAEAVRAMLQGAPAQYAWVWAESGIYGPAGARASKAVGTVHFGIRDPRAQITSEFAQLSGEREQMRSQIQQLGAAFLLEHLRKGSGG